MHIYNKYIVKTIIPILLILTLVITGLVWIIQILNFISLIDKGISLGAFINLVVLLLPYLLFIIMPLISVLSAIYVYGKLQEDKQLVVLSCSGLNNYQLLKPALVVFTFVSLIAYYLSLYLMPISYNQLKSELGKFRDNYISNMIEPQTFNPVSKYVTIYAYKKNSNRSLEGVILFDNKVPADKTILLAKEGEIVDFSQQKIKFRLKNGLRYSYDNLGNITKLYFDDMLVEVASESNNYSQRTKTSLELFVHEMLWPDQNLSQEKQNRLTIDGHMRLVWPAFNFAFVFLALSVFLKFPYNRKNYIKPYIYAFIPILSATYLHFTIQKLAYKNPEYVFLCYANIFICIIVAIILQNIRR